MTLPILSAPSIQNLRSGRLLEESAALSANDIRETVVLVVGTEYRAVVQAYSYVNASNAHVMYAEALHFSSLAKTLKGT